MKIYLRNPCLHFACLPCWAGGCLLSQCSAQLPLPTVCSGTSTNYTPSYQAPRKTELTTTCAKWLVSHRISVAKAGIRFGSPELHSCLHHENMFSSLQLSSSLCPSNSCNKVQVVQSTFTFIMAWFILQHGSFLCATQHRRPRKIPSAQRNHTQFPLPHQWHNPPESPCAFFCLFCHQEIWVHGSDGIPDPIPACNQARLQLQWAAGSGKTVLNASSPRAGACPDVSWNGSGRPVAHRCLLAWSKSQEYQE